MTLPSTLPSGAAQADAQRARAAALRRLAGRMECADLTGLSALAGTDTWQGPLADQCRSALQVMRGRFFGNAASLRIAASRLERLADDIAAQPDPDGSP